MRRPARPSPVPVLSLVLVLPLALLLIGAGTPAPGPVRIIGAHGAGCIAGAVRLPDSAPGLQTIRLAHSTFWGHPATIAALLALGAQAHAAGLADLFMGDVSNPRGGPLPGGHQSHQMGIDADVYLDLSPRRALTAAEREAIEPPSMVRADGRATDPARFGPAQVTLLHLASGLPGVDRILVGAAIKRQLCRSVTGDRAWLRLIRPWWGHTSHFHINFVCPADQPQCPARPPLPQGEGCDASLQWWFDQSDQPPAPATPAAPPPAPPAACAAILGDPGG